jgi:hypothetical protein
MNVVLQQVRTGLYFTPPEKWVKEIAEAHDFGSSQRAIQFARQHRLRGVQVIVAFIEASCVDTVALEAGPDLAGAPEFQPQYL